MNTDLKEIFERSIREKRFNYIITLASALINDPNSLLIRNDLEFEIKSREYGYVSEIRTLDLCDRFKVYQVKWRGYGRAEYFRVTVWGPHYISVRFMPRSSLERR